MVRGGHKNCMKMVCLMYNDTKWYTEQGSCSCDWTRCSFRSRIRKQYLERKPHKSRCQILCSSKVNWNKLNCRKSRRARATVPHIWRCQCIHSDRHRDSGYSSCCQDRCRAEWIKNRRINSFSSLVRLTFDRSSSCYNSNVIITALIFHHRQKIGIRKAGLS